MKRLFGCFSFRSGRSQRKNKHGKDVVSTCQAFLRKGSSRRDKAQVLPDSGVENEETEISHELEVIKSRAPDETEGRETCEGHNSEAFHSTAPESKDPAEPSVRGRDDYLSIDSVFPASLFSDERFDSEDDDSISTPALRSLKKAEDAEDCTSLSSRSTQTHRSFDEKPIMGLVAADWPEPDSSEIKKSHKAWDGKGIPNSTSKYKEDQTINFQTLSFEARLEQALAAQNM